jgi:maltose alpha-D-glucosyltransferase / alpha-amylase
VSAISISQDWLRARRWFAGKNRPIERITLAEQVSLSPNCDWGILEVAYAEGPSERYSLALPISQTSDAFDSPECQQLLYRLLAGSAQRGPIRFHPLADIPPQPGPSKPLGVEQSNTSIRYGREWILKLLRQVEPGENRDLEVGRFLTLEASFPHTPQVAGAITYAGTATLGVLQRYVENEGDGWTYVRSQLDALLEEAPNAPDDVYWVQDGLPDRDEPLLAQIELLGRITGEMHHALASRPDLPAFAPEPCTQADLAAWQADLEAQRAQAVCHSERGEPSALEPRMLRFALNDKVGAIPKIQIHGDYHLGQVLKTAEGFTIVDFEGEPARPLRERRAKQPAMRDVAGMLRSLHYAAWATALASPERHLEAWAEDWAGKAGDRFLQGWQATAHQPLDLGLLRLFQLAKAFYELNYELNNRPNWVQVPTRGIEALLRDA